MPRPAKTVTEDADRRRSGAITPDPGRRTTEVEGRTSAAVVERWLEALDRRYLADLTPSEVARALRALSSCYVERRAKLRSGGALDTRGKRAAFALFYGPVHFFVATRVLEALDPTVSPPSRILDIGCGTGAAGAAWALRSGTPISGFDRHSWAVEEANRTYRELGMRGRARQADALRGLARAERCDAIVLAYVVNELEVDTRAAVREALLRATSRGARLLMIEPIARRLAPWWSEWEKTFGGARADEWRFREPLPRRQRDLARAAGLDPQELTARTLFV